MDGGPEAKVEKSMEIHVHGLSSLEALREKLLVVDSRP